MGWDQRDSFQPSCPSTSRASPETPLWARTWKPPQMCALSEQWHQQSVSLSSLAGSAGFFRRVSLAKCLMHLYNYKEVSDFRDTQHILTFVLPTVSGDLHHHGWTEGWMLSSTILESTDHRIGANAIIIYKIFKNNRGTYTMVFGVNQTACVVLLSGASTSCSRQVKGCQITFVWYRFLRVSAWRFPTSAF